MLTDLRRAVVALVVFTVLVGLAYPLLMFGVGQSPSAAARRGAWSGGPTARWSAPA
jgi:K+-transporting ATPase c subunit